MFQAFVIKPNGTYVVLDAKLGSLVNNLEDNK